MINGLTYSPAYLTTEEQQELWQIINEQPWLGDLKRRVQHYGYKYDYKARRIDVSMKIGEMPIWVDTLAARLWKENIFPEKPDQLIINEYEAGQGIAPHVDCEPCFTDTIVSISLGSACMMDFIHLHTKEKRSILLEVGSMVVLKDESRYDWQHTIAPRKTDVFENQSYTRSKRISLTFRKVILA
jgi:alkylated DNA repair dioxygenase AlkB